MAETESTKLSPLQIKRALNRNIVAGCFGMLFATCTSLQFATQFALELGASKFQIGLLTTLPLLGYPLQLVSAYLVERIGRRKKFWFVDSFIYRLLWFPLLAIPFLIGQEFQSTRVFLFLLLIFLSNALATMSVAPWFSWLADLVPPEKAGKFWSRRSAILNAMMLSSLFLGRFVDMFTQNSNLPAGSLMRFMPFAILFGVGCILGEIDLLIHNRIPEPPMKKPAVKLDLLAMIKQPFLDPPFRRFLVWNCTWSFAATLINAYVMVYFLETLALSQFFISVLVSVSLICRVYVAKYWGFLADRFGHVAINTICDFCLILIPVAYLFITPQNCMWLLIVMHLWAGIFGSGLDTASTALMLGLPRSENKSMSIAVLYSLVGIFAAFAPLLGGWILQHFEGHSTQFMMWQYDNFKMLFLIVLLLRLLFFPFSLRLSKLSGSSTGIVVRRLMDSNPFRVIRHVHVLSESPAEARRVAAVQELASARSSIATRELIQALDDPSREVRQEAAHALARIGDAEAVEPLIRSLQSREAGIQQPAAYALGKIRDTRAVPALIEALKQKHLAEYAAVALGEIGDRSAINPLLEVLRQPDVSGSTCASVANALSRMGETSALPDMLSALQNTTSRLVREEMALAIGNLFGRPGEFYNLLTRERQVAGEELSRLLEQVVGDSDRFESTGDPIEQVKRELDQGQTAYNREQWREACQAYARAGILLAGSRPGDHPNDGMFDFLTEWLHPHRSKLRKPLMHPDSESAPLWFLLAIAYPQTHEPSAHNTQEESLLAFYAFRRIWDGKTS